MWFWFQRLLISLAIFFLQLSWARAETVRAKVVAVIDGDTIQVLLGKRSTRVRLFGVDCPERFQAFYSQARKFTDDLIFQKTITLQFDREDPYGRKVAVATLDDGRVLNRELVGSGWCWWYEYFAPDDKELKRLAQEAKAARRGIWSRPSPIPPWEFKRQQKRIREWQERERFNREQMR